MKDVSKMIPAGILTAVNTLLVTNCGMSLQAMVDQKESKQLEGYMSMAEVAKYSSMHRQTIWRAIKAGSLIAKKSNPSQTGKLLFKQSDVQAWIEGMARA